MTAEERRRSLTEVAATAATRVIRERSLHALGDLVWCVREIAVINLARFLPHDEVAWKKLLELTRHDPSPYVRLAAGRALGAHTEPERDYGDAIRHRFERQRVRAATALGCVIGSRTREAVALLAVSLADSHPKVRLAALRALWQIEANMLKPVIPAVVRKCAEANTTIATTALAVWRHALSHPAHAVLLPLRPFAGTANVSGVRQTLAELPVSHPLKLASQLQSSEDTQTFARALAQLCARALAVESLA